MATTIDIPEGRMNDFLVHGVFVIIAGGVLFLVHWSLSVLMVALAVVLFRISSGIEIDLSGKRVRVYKVLGNLRFGAWLSVEPYSAISLRYTNESQAMGGRGPELTVRVRTYDLHFASADGASLLFHEFTDYAKAHKCGVTMAEHWAFELSDEVQERRQRALTNPQTRRR